MDMTPTIVPKSDQKNADDLLSGPITIKITKVSIRPGTEQPVSVFFEGDEGKPWKPCKSMARVLVFAWGPDASKYVGRSLTLFCDPKVRWAGMEVGGIRISHMSDIDSSITMALTVTRANKKPFTVQPLVSVSEPTADLITDETVVADIQTWVKRKKFDVAYDLVRSISDEVLRHDTKARIDAAKVYVEQKA